MTKATAGINTHGGHDGHRSVTPQPDQHNRPDRAVPWWDQSAVGSQSDSATHWLEMIPHVLLKLYTRAWGADMWQWCHSRMTEVRRVFHGCRQGGWLGYSEEPGCKKTSLFWLRDLGGNVCGGWCNNLFEAVTASHLSQVIRRKSCGLYVLCGTEMIFSMSYITLLHSQLYRLLYNYNINIINIKNITVYKIVLYVICCILCIFFQHILLLFSFSAKHIQHRKNANNYAE